MICKECREDFSKMSWGKPQEKAKLCDTCYFQEMWKIDGVKPSGQADKFIKLLQKQGFKDV